MEEFCSYVFGSQRSELSQSGVFVDSRNFTELRGEIDVGIDWDFALPAAHARRAERRRELPHSGANCRSSTTACNKEDLGGRSQQIVG